MSNNGTSSSVNATAPPWQVPYQQYGLNQAQSQYQNIPNLVAPFAPQQEQAITNVTNMANQGNPAVNAAQNFATNTLNGNVQTNPELNSLFSQGANQIQQQIASQFAGAGRNVDQSAGANALALGTFGSNLFGNAFNTEAGLQNSAMYAAPSLLNSQLGLQNSLYGAGQNVQNLAQQYIQAPQTSLNQYLSRVNGNLGSTQSTPYNPITGGIGGGLLGSQLGSTIGNYFGSDYGGLVGGGLGALLGAIG